MNNSNEILKLLNEKKILFLEVEQITNDIMSAPVSDIAATLERRGKLLDSVVLLDQKISAFVGNDAVVRSVLNNTCDASSLSKEYSTLFEASLKIKAIVNRIRNSENGIKERITTERDNTLAKIERLNQSSVSVAEKYKRSLETGFPQGRGFDSNKKI